MRAQKAQAIPDQAMERMALRPSRAHGSRRADEPSNQILAKIPTEMSDILEAAAAKGPDLPEESKDGAASETTTGAHRKVGGMHRRDIGVVGVERAKLRLGEDRDARPRERASQSFHQAGADDRISEIA